MRRIILSNITCQSAGSPLICSLLTGIPQHPIEDLKLNNVMIFHQGGGTSEDAARQLPEKEKDYPEPNMFGATSAHGFFVRHVRGLEMESIKIEHSNQDARPVFVLTDVQRVDFERIKAPSAAGVPTFVLNDVRDFNVSGSKPVPDIDLETVDHKQL